MCLYNTGSAAGFSPLSTAFSKTKLGIALVDNKSLPEESEWVEKKLSVHLYR